MTEIDPVAEFERRFPEVDAAFKKVEADQKRAMFDSATSQSEEREQIYYSVRAIGVVRKAIIAELTNRHVQKIAEERAATLAKPGAATA